jgi:hypothetical protein
MCLDSGVAPHNNPRTFASPTFEQLVDAFANGDGSGRMFGIAKMFRMFHDKFGRYPTFEEICPPGRPVIRKRPVGEQSRG